MKNFLSNIITGVGIVLGVALLALGGYMGIGNLQAPGSLNVPITVFSLAAIIVGLMMLWLVSGKNENI